MFACGSKVYAYCTAMSDANEKRSIEVPDLLPRLERITPAVPARGGTTVEFATMTGASAIVSVVGNGDTPGVLGNVEVGSNDKKERGWSGVGIQGHSPMTREKGKEKLDYSFLEEGSSSSIGSIEDYTTIRCTSSNVRGGSSKPKFIEVSGV